MQIDVARRLTHSITLQASGSLTEDATPAYDSPGVSVQCFIEPVTRRLLSDNSRIIVTSFDIYFLGSTVIKAGDKLVNGMNSAGETILLAGIVESLDDSYHPVDGRKARFAAVRTVVQ